MFLARATAALSLSAIVGCGDKAEDTRDSAADEPPTADELVCLQTDEGGIEMRPGPTATPTAPAMLEINVPYTLILSSSAGGWVRVPLTPGDYQLWMGKAGLVSGMVFGTTPAAPPTPAPNQSCPDEIAEQYTFTVTQEQEVFFSVKPTIEPSSWVMLTAVETFGAAVGAGR